MSTTVYPILGHPTIYLTEDHKEIAIRPMLPTGREALLDFFRSIPQKDRFYLEEDVTSPQVIAGWAANLDYSRALPLPAIMDGKVVSHGTLHRSQAMARSHVGELPIVVEPAYRQIGLGRRLIREMLDLGVKMALPGPFSGW
jgi:GNAT superfamily N-acetyltransferase